MRGGEGEVWWGSLSQIARSMKDCGDIDFWSFTWHPESYVSQWEPICSLFVGYKSVSEWLIMMLWKGEVEYHVRQIEIPRCPIRIKLKLVHMINPLESEENESLRRLKSIILMYCVLLEILWANNGYFACFKLSIIHSFHPCLFYNVNSAKSGSCFL